MVPNLSVVMSVFEEEELLPRALASLSKVGIAPGQVVVFDGAWAGGKDGEHVFANSEGPSKDSTMQIAKEWGACCVEVEHPWQSQEDKRTAMFRAAHSWATHIFVMDADEELEGSFPHDFPDDHCNIMVRCVGPNDLPGIRGVWPHGDYCADYKPELRLFKRFPDLECVYPGGYIAARKWIEAYDGIESALPILDGVTMLHHGNDRSDDRKAQKIAYYKEEHPERARFQKVIHKMKTQST